MNEDVKDCLKELPESLGAKVCFNFKEVDCITSLGARFWLAFLSRFEGGRHIEYIECSHEVIQQVNIFPRFIGHGTIRSFYGSFTCPGCGGEESRLFSKEVDIDEVVRNCKDIDCPECGTTLELDEDERAFFSFLKTAV